MKCKHDRSNVSKQFLSIPRILVLHLKRFRHRLSAQKVEQSVDFPEDLALGKGFSFLIKVVATFAAPVVHVPWACDTEVLPKPDYNASYEEMKKDEEKRGM